jgi:multidrug efflux pump subunit AcrA (membrane-fusion protein)
MIACKQKPNEEVMPIRKDISEIVFASGTLESDDRYNLTAQTEGNILSIYVEEGKYMNKGAVAAIIDNPTNIINTQQAREQLDIAQYNTTDNAPMLKQLKANIVAAEDRLNQDIIQEQRYQKLYEQQSATKSELERYQLNTKSSRANLQALQAQYKTLQQQNKQQYIQQKGSVRVSQENQRNNTIYIINSGKVYKQLKHKGDYVRRGDVIAIIANENLLYAKLNIDENSINKVNVGQEVSVKLNTQKNKIYIGKISEILPQFDEPSQSFIAKVQFDTLPDFTINGTQLEANILIGNKKNALLIPRNYMFYGNKVQLKSQKNMTTVVPGIISTEYVEILEGLKESDIIVPIKP